MRTHRGDFRDRDSAPEPIPFPNDPVQVADKYKSRPRTFDLACLPDSAGRALDAIDSISRRIDDLARELNCLGYFDDGDDQPPAA